MRKLYSLVNAFAVYCFCVPSFSYINSIFHKNLLAVMQ